MDDKENTGAERRKRRTGVEQLVPLAKKAVPPQAKRYWYPCAEMSGIPRPPGLHRLQTMNWSGRIVATANALVETGILVAEVMEEGGHHGLLVFLARKVA